MGKIDNETYYRIIHYYSFVSLTDGSYLLYGYEEGKGFTGNVIVKELKRICH